MCTIKVDDIKIQVAQLPLSPGVYQFLNGAGEIIYVGKAKSLRKRVSSYFMSGKDHPLKVKVMVRHITQVKHIVVETEADALLLENSMIKSLQPKYNILLKDDKTYPWIVVRNEPFPRIESTRTVVRDGSRYFGPYASGLVQKNLLELIHALYPIRTCKLNLSPEMVARGKYTVCLQYHIGGCKGPCTEKQNTEDYQRCIELATAMLRGELRSTRTYIEKNMMDSSQDMKFEQATRYKHKLEMLENYSSKSVIVSSTISNLDIFTMVTDEDSLYCNFVRVVNGSIVNSFTVRFSLGAEDEPRDILSRAMVYMSDIIGGELAREVVVPFVPQQSLFPGVKFTVPTRGDKMKLLEFSERAARLYRLDQLKNLEIKDPERHTRRIMEGLQKELHLRVEPRHIECFDNSNLQGTNAVAACVVFRDGKPSPKEYRHFNVKTVVGSDDFATMKEIITRRYSRLLREGADLPQLVVVDGGKGQLSSAWSVFEELGLTDRITVVGLAKRIEEVFFPNDPMPYYLSRTGEPLRVMMHIRDEAHRFGITFHRNKRSAAFIGSELESIPTLGKQSVEKLLKRFKTVAAVRRASAEELEAEVGKARAAAIATYFEGGGEEMLINK